MKFCLTCGDYTLPTQPGGYLYYDYCPACRRNMIMSHNNWVARASTWAFQSGYDMDSSVANYYTDLDEDGGLRWRCRPHSGYEEEPLRSLVCNGYFARMDASGFSGATYQYMLDSAYNAGSDPKCHTGFHIPHTSNGFDFKLNVNHPNITFGFHEDGSDTITFRRSNIFSDKQLMDKFDAGVFSYIAANKEHLRARILREAKQENDQAIEHQRLSSQYTAQSIFLFFYFLITSIIAISMFGGGFIGNIFSGVLCLTSSIHNFQEREHPIKVHAIMLVAVLGLTKMILGFFAG